MYVTNCYLLTCKEIYKEVINVLTQDNIQLPSLREKEDDVPVITGDIMEELKILMQTSTAIWVALF